MRTLLAALLARHKRGSPWDAQDVALIDALCARVGRVAEARLKHPVSLLYAGPLAASFAELAPLLRGARMAAHRHNADAALCAEHLRARGIDNALAERFGLGFAAGGKTLAKQLGGLTNVSVASCLQAGLVFHTGGETFDRFRARLMIPIHDAHGRVVGRRCDVVDAARVGLAAA